MSQLTSNPGTANGAAIALATQAANYARAVAAGTPHDLGEARSMVATARTLVEILTATEEEIQAGAPNRIGRAAL